MNIFTYILRRLLQIIPIYFLIITLVFVGVRLFPGDPFLFQIKRITDYQLQLYLERVRLHGLDQPIWEQYKIYLKNLFTGNWGDSWYLANGAPVWPLIKFSIKNSLEFLLLTLTGSYFIGTRLGKWAAGKKNRYLTGSMRWGIVFMSAIPILLVAMISQYYMGQSLIFYKYTRGIKSALMGDPTYVTGMRLIDCILDLRFDLAWDTLLHYLVPGITFTLPIIALVSNHTRSSMLDVLQTDYIRTAQAKGCPPNYLLKKHAFRNSIIPVVSIMGMSFPLFISNLILVEYLYSLPGFGALFYLAFKFLDYNVLIAITCMSVTISVAGNFIADVLYAIVDPRIRY
ncbi:MAG: ABC transporter permease [Promethearchaeota archaeon]